ncbi:MAG: 23S rRNA (adenine(2503)-C(2))-methyltransferase RlmN, partial [Acidobacteriaceae bacterium]
MKPNTLIGLDAQELTSLVQDQGQPAYRANQLRKALYSQRVPSLESISILPQEFRQRLIADGYSVGLPRIERKFQSTDGTIRYLMLLDDGQSVETVWMPEGDDGETGDGSDAGGLDQKRSENSGKSWNRATICVSSQVGCAVACQFCMTALLGVKRNLTAGEIVGQVCVVLSDHSVSLQDSRINLVFMGMGEPFLNYDNFIKAVRLLVQNVGVAESRITVSTAGIVPRIYDLGIEAVRPKLAISLNA